MQEEKFQTIPWAEDARSPRPAVRPGKPAPPSRAASAPSAPSSNQGPLGKSWHDEWRSVNLKADTGHLSWDETTVTIIWSYESYMYIYIYVICVYFLPSVSSVLQINQHLQFFCHCKWHLPHGSFLSDHWTFAVWQALAMGMTQKLSHLRPTRLDTKRIIAKLGWWIVPGYTSGLQQIG